MKKYKYMILFSCFILGVISLSACRKANFGSKNEIPTLNEAIVNEEIKENNTENNNIGGKNETHLSLKLIENIMVDADVEHADVKQCILYKTSAKQFEVETVKQMFFSEKNDLNIEKNGESTCIETKDGVQLFIDPADITFIRSDKIYNILNLIQNSYYTELKYVDDKQLSLIEQEEIVQKTEKMLSEIYQPSEIETLFLKAGVKVETDTIIKKQEELKNDEGVKSDYDSGVLNEIDKDWKANQCYYLCFAIKNEGIPMLNSNEPAVGLRDENAEIVTTDLQVIVDETGIQFLNISEAFKVEKDFESDIMSVDNAMQEVKDKYNLQINALNYVIDKIWLEYIAIQDPSSQENCKGTLEPYWCFEMKWTDSDNNEHIKADRINAVTGDDLAYE